VVKQQCKEQFSKENVNCISEIIPLHELRTCHSTFGDKRRLSLSYDKFLADERIHMYLPTLLGKWFIEKDKMPIPICLTKRDLKKVVHKGLCTVSLRWLSSKSMYNVTVGSNKLSVAACIENVSRLLSQLPNKVPGGWANVKSVSIASKWIEEIPIYLSTSTTEIVFKADPIPGKVTGELSTKLDTEVVVYDDLSIEVQKKVQKTHSRRRRVK